MSVDYGDMDEKELNDEKNKQKAKSELKDIANDIGKQVFKDTKNPDIPDTKIPNSNMPNTPNPTNSFNSANSTNGATIASGAGKAGAAGAGTTGMAGTGVAAGSGAGAAGGAGGGAAAGAAAGSVAPGVGTAIGAAGGAVVAKKAADNGMDAVEQTTKTKVKFNEKTGKQQNQQPILVKIIIAFIALPLVIVFILIYSLYNTLTSTIAPVLALFSGAANAWNRVSGFVQDIGKDEPTYEETSEFVKEMIQEGCREAYLTVCYKEVYQIAVENNYDIDRTIQSYNGTQFPYYFDETYCNINYAEILSIMSLSKDFSYKNFEYSKFKELFQDEEFLRTLYDLDVVRTEILVAEGLGTGDYATTNPDGSVTITFRDGSTQICTFDFPGCCSIIVYGEVSVSRYPLKKLYDYFGVDPYGASKVLPSMTNHQAISTLEATTRNYGDINWGSYERSPLLDYKRLTGEITENVQNQFAKDLINDPVISDTHVYMDVEEFKQGNSEWSGLKYGSGTMGKLGCCVTSMAMVCNYFSNESINPKILWQYMNSELNGSLYRDTVAKHYGFKQYNSTAFNPKVVIGELKNERLIITHIKSFQKGTGKWGHWVVLCGFEVTNGEGIFYVKEPASRLESTISLEEATMIFDVYQSYGY